MNNKLMMRANGPGTTQSFPLSLLRINNYAVSGTFASDDASNDSEASFPGTANI